MAKKPTKKKPAQTKTANVPAQVQNAVVQEAAKASLAQSEKAMERLNAHDVAGAMRILIQSDMSRANEIIAATQEVQDGDAA